MLNRAIQFDDTTPPTEEDFIETMLWKASSASDILRTSLKDDGESSLSIYLRKVFRYSPISLQPRNDVAEAIYRTAEPLLGSEKAAGAATTIITHPIAMTANHHGVDFFAQSVQSSLLFALGNKLCCDGATSALVFACGNIPLDNITYPQGFMVYGVSEASSNEFPTKVPLFPNSLRRWVVSTSTGYDSQMVNRTLRNVEKMVASGSFPKETGDALCRILREGYLSNKILDLQNYAEQATCLNQWIWRQMLSDPGMLPQLVYLELEQITAHLLLNDLSDDASLVQSIFFDGRLRKNIIKELDGHQACWSCEADSDPGNRPGDGVVKGTHFFWGISKKGRKFALSLQSDGDGNVSLCGTDNSGDSVRYSFSPGSLKELIIAKKIIPSVFTCFLEIAFARGINCVGGYYQAAYLPKMVSGVVRALNHTTGFASCAKVLEQIPTNAYLSGMQTVMTEVADQYLVPAGPIEIIKNKGIQAADLDKIKSMTVETAHTASLSETIPDIAPWELEETGWKRKMATHLHHLLKDRVVVV